MTLGVTAVIVTGGAVLAPAAATAGVAAGTGAAAAGTASAVGTATAAAAGGAAVTASATGAAVGTAATVAGTTAASVGTMGVAGGAAVEAVVVGGSLAGPVGWFLLGTAQEETVYTFDCWKPILHDDSKEPSNGILLKDLAIDTRVRRITPLKQNTPQSPAFIVENIWDEEFTIEFFNISPGHTVAHARIRT